MQPQVVHLAPGTVIAGKFRVLRLLGVGGMGVVYEIEHELTKHRRALKLLHSQFCAYPAAVARFLREASAAGRIGNAHIVETFDAGQLDSGEPYIVMEQLDGETLADRLGRENVISVAAIADIIEQACIGIQAAHERGIIHRDLKPENLFIERRDGKPFVRILDFGVSKFDTALTGGLGLTGEGLALGTPFYMPPEQIRGEKSVDARSDIYALGVILYEAVTGRRPYEADTLPHLAVLIHEGNAATLESLRPELPAHFRELVHRAMASDPDERHPSARALGEALALFAGAEPSLGGPSESEGAVDVSVEGVALATPGTLLSPAAPRRAPSMGTPMAQSAPAPVEKARPRSRGVALIGGGTLLVGLVAAWQFTGSRGAAPVPAVSGPAVSAREAPSLAVPPPAARIAPEAGTPAFAVEIPAPPTSALPDPAPRPAAAKIHPAPRSVASPSVDSHPSRAEQKGLANENPFR
jgi:hypothetical protein